MLKASNAVVAEVFVYTGGRGAAIPDDAVRIRVNSSVTSIPAEAFSERRSLAEVELCEGLLKLEMILSGIATIPLRESLSPHHSKGLAVVPSGTLYELLLLVSGWY